jgi:hypothetical protein
MMMMIVHSCYILINQRILSLKGSLVGMVMMIMRSKRAVVGVSHWTVPLGQHYNLVVFFTEKRSP